MTVMTRSTMTTANSMASQSTSGLETQQQQQQQQNLIVFAMKHTLLVKRTFEQEFPGETLPLADAFREVCSIVRQGYIMQYDDQREERRDRRTQQRHEETMAADREDPGWLDTIQSRRATMYEALMNEALKTLYLFFFLHVIWHFARFHQVWTFTGILTALKYSVSHNDERPHTTNTCKHALTHSLTQSLFASFLFFTSRFVASACSKRLVLNGKILPCLVISAPSFHLGQR